jgi:hypothetical protein
MHQSLQFGFFDLLRSKYITYIIARKPAIPVAASRRLTDRWMNSDKAAFEKWCVQRASGLRPRNATAEIAR